MYRFMSERTLFSQLQRQAIGVSQRYYQCNETGVYGYHPHRVEPFKRKSNPPCRQKFIEKLKNEKFPIRNGCRCRVRGRAS